MDTDTNKSERKRAEIKSYKVATNMQGSYGYHLRWLSLEAVKYPIDRVEVESVDIYFFIKEWASTNKNFFGSYSPSKKNMFVYLPISEFEDMYKILQTEKPVSFYWAADSNNNHQLTVFGLSSTDELPGEGPTDSTWYQYIENRPGEKPKDFNEEL